MGYVNPLLAYGPARAVSDAKDAGANGFIVVDLPLEEEPEFFKACKQVRWRLPATRARTRSLTQPRPQNKMSFVPLVAPTTTDARLALLVAAADTFLYCVSITGVTGQRDKLSEELPGFVARVRRATKLPIAIGFGISTAQHVAEVGSALRLALCIRISLSRARSRPPHTLRRRAPSQTASSLAPPSSRPCSTPRAPTPQPPSPPTSPRCCRRASERPFIRLLHAAAARQ
jgi:hypothetical protein